jgi:threonine aldolase
MDVIDLRSDTVTRPTRAMRAAMAEAEVGDDVYGEDPTVNALQEQIADLLGTEAALWVPTGVMANQIALAAQVRAGDCVMIGRDTHCWLYETGALAALAGAQVHALPGDGRFTAADVRAAYRADDHHTSPTTAIAIENTHNLGGGLVWDPSALASVLADASRLGLVRHLDGARLWNAAVALGTTERALAAGFDSISVCLSKGLGAPAGSVVAGSRDLIRSCHRLRKQYGGGMRQVGILAAAGVYALAHHRARLADDHARARRLAVGLAAVPGLTVDVDAVASNIVIVGVVAGDAPALAAAARARGLRISAFGTGRLRAVLHLDVDDAAVERAIQLLAELVGAPR